jgi:hypothetical protein
MAIKGTDNGSKGTENRNKGRRSAHRRITSSSSSSGSDSSRSIQHVADRHGVSQWQPHTSPTGSARTRESESQSVRPDRSSRTDAAATNQERRVSVACCTACVPCVAYRVLHISWYVVLGMLSGAACYMWTIAWSTFALPCCMRGLQPHSTALGSASVRRRV